MDYLKELAARANLSASWEAWTPEYRVLAIGVALALAYWVLRVVVPAVLRILRPVFIVAFPGRRLGAVSRGDLFDRADLEAADGLRTLASVPGLSMPT